MSFYPGNRDCLASVLLTYTQFLVLSLTFWYYRSLVWCFEVTDEISDHFAGDVEWSIMIERTWVVGISPLTPHHRAFVVYVMQYCLAKGYDWIYFFLDGHRKLWFYVIFPFYF